MEYMKKRDFIFNTLKQVEGCGEGTKLYTCITVNTGETEVVIEKTITERYPIQEIERVEDLYERLTCGSGRKVWKLEEIAHPYNPN